MDTLQYPRVSGLDPSQRPASPAPRTAQNREAMTDTRMVSAMIRLMMAGVLVAGVTSIARAQDPVKKGEELFTAQKCSLCHSVAGKGNKKYPLDGVGAKLSAADLKEWLVNPDGMQAKKAEKPLMKMKSFKTLPAADIDALVAYLGSLK
jgi:mono/diheme cytochrome c family protein